MTQVDIILEDFGAKGRYVHRLDGDEAEMTFVKVGDKQIILDHTSVPSRFRGQGVGEALIKRAIEDAREKGFRINPLCPYVASQFRRHPEWTDVLAD